MQNDLNAISEQNPGIDFLTGGTANEIRQFKYSMPKRMWLDFLDETLEKEINHCKTMSWQIGDDIIERIKGLIQDGAHIYKENKKGNNLLSVILEQPNTELKKIVCKIAKYPLNVRDLDTITICRHGIEKVYCAPKGMSLREAQERGLLLEKY